MREQDDVPEWALEHIRGKLRGGEEIINAVAFRRGLFSGYVLFNTSKGAALVTRGGIGAPQSALLTFPRDLVTFSCVACGGRSLIIDAEPPSDVHCTHCGIRNHIALGEGEATVAGMQVPEADAVPRGQAAVEGGAYVHGDHTLYARTETTPAGRARTKYFFSTLAPRDAREAPLPEGHEVVVGRSGVPRLKRSATVRAQGGRTTGDGRTAKRPKSRSRTGRARKGAPKASGAKKPVRTRKTTKTSQPTKTPKPRKTSKPTRAAKAERVAKPAKTPKPRKTSKPAKTPKPRKTSKPAKTPKPRKTSKPTTTRKPRKTSKPTTTRKPRTTSKPAKTPKPRKTSKPAKTPRPKRTSKPRTTSGGLSEKQLAQRKYAARMKGVRKRAAQAKGGRGPVAERSAAKRLRRELGLKAGSASNKRSPKAAKKASKKRGRRR